MGTLAEFVEVVCKERGAALMAVLNVTPDSFFAASRAETARAASARIDALLAEGADVIDVGAESTRPGASPVPAEEQLRRALPAIRYAVSRGALVSVDTTLPDVARAALEAGARVVNDVSCLGQDELARVVAEADADLVLMHSRGSMTTMLGFGCYPEEDYEDVVADVGREWKQAAVRAEAEGLLRGRIWFDPGLGFHKSAEHSIELLRRLAEFGALGAPLCVGVSRKSFIAAVDGAPPEVRLGGTIAACLRAVDAGARLLRVHDVQAVRQAIALDRVLEPQQQKGAARLRGGPTRRGVAHDA